MTSEKIKSLKLLARISSLTALGPKALPTDIILRASNNPDAAPTATLQYFLPGCNVFSNQDAAKILDLDPAYFRNKVLKKKLFKEKVSEDRYHEGIHGLDRGSLTSWYEANLLVKEKLKDTRRDHLIVWTPASDLDQITVD